jgi:UPF0755 protein
VDIDGPTRRLGPVRSAERRPDPAPDRAPDDAETAPLRTVATASEPEERAPVPRATRVGRAERSRRAERSAPRRGRGRRTAVLLVAVAVLLVAVGGGGLYLYRTYLASDPDFTGPGEGDVVVQVAPGDSTAAIGRTLSAAGVVASVAAFLDAAAADERVLGVQPGSYQMRLRMSAAAAVERLLDPTALVGRLEIRPGVQLDDTRAPDGTVAPGVLSLVAAASCTQRDGVETCLTAEELRETMAGTDPAELGVPAWAQEAVARAEPVRRLEGLIAPGVHDVEPGAPAVDVLRTLVTDSTDELAPLVSGAEAAGEDPYEVLVVASLVEKEGITADMPRVARVVYNRLSDGQRLELDSTVNYPLDLQALATTDDDRARPGPYNTYRTGGLPPTPIAAVGADAIAAALDPEPGPWRYFVKCQTDGTSCFAETFPEHQDNIATARANGAF